MQHDISRKESDPRTAPSGRFLLRVGSTFHGLLRSAAAEAGLSLNDYCVRRLVGPAPDPAVLAPAVAAIERAARRFGERLLGIVLHGSWARGEATDASDIDLLVVLDDAVPLERGLYRSWDENPLAWEARRVEVHFAHLPKRSSAPGGLWAEVALDGILLFERGLEISRRLSAIRRAILAGRMTRRSAQGQPYWIEVA